MQKFIAALVVAAGLALPVVAEARPRHHAHHRAHHARVHHRVHARKADVEECEEASACEYEAAIARLEAQMTPQENAQSDTELVEWQASAAHDEVWTEIEAEQAEEG